MDLAIKCYVHNVERVPISLVPIFLLRYYILSYIFTFLGKKSAAESIGIAFGFRHKEITDSVPTIILFNILRKENGSALLQCPEMS